MQEDFIHYLWKHKKFASPDLKTTKGQRIDILSSGIHNHDAGPDFFNAQVRLDGQLWAGNVEIHLKSSDWFVHNHETDAAYDNVVLHVVWEHDTDIYRKDNSEVDTLELKGVIPQEYLNSYRQLFTKDQKWINCEQDFPKVDGFLLDNWLERLYFERLERKSEDINRLLLESKNDWEAVLFKMLAKNFGLRVNGDSFLSIASSFDFNLVRKERHKLDHIEALLLGQAGLLHEEKEDGYFHELKSIHRFQSKKYGLNNESVLPVRFFRLRPSNFPTIRLSQLANLYHEHAHLFSKIITARSEEKIHELFAIAASSYWEAHYAFGKVSRRSKKRTSSSFIDLLLINTIVPFKFSYAKHHGKEINGEILEWMSKLDLERNSIVDKFNDMKPVFDNAMHSQALLQLKGNYCDKNNCLQCVIGNAILTN